ncbi:MAG: hypothetical protein ACI8WT_001474 [Clostridium sp.]|jgi:hypothetical protein
MLLILYIGKKVGMKSMAHIITHIPEILLDQSIHLIPFLLHWSFLKHLIPTTKKSNAVIITRIFIENNILNILASKILYFITVYFYLFVCLLISKHIQSGYFMKNAKASLSKPLDLVTTFIFRI